MQHQRRLREQAVLQRLYLPAVDIAAVAAIAAAAVAAPSVDADRIAMLAAGATSAASGLPSPPPAPRRHQ